MEKEFYVAPDIDFIEVRVEKGFAQSVIPVLEDPTEVPVSNW